MNQKWPTQRLGAVLRHRKKFITIDDVTTYKRPRVQLHANGIVVRDEIPGALIKTKQQQICRAGELLVAEIDAKVGGFGIVPDALDGAIVSSHYFLFGLIDTKVDRDFLGYFIRTPLFRDQVEAQGSTNYAAIRPTDVLDYEIPLPSLDEQKRVVVRIEELAAQIREARGLREQAILQGQAVVGSTVSRYDHHLRTIYPLTSLESLASPEQGSIRSGPFGSALLHSEFVADGVPAIGIQDVQENRFELTRKWTVTAAKARELKRYTIRPGDILITVMGTLGRACVVPENAPMMISTKHVWTVTLDRTKAEPHWVSLWLNYSHVLRQELLGQGTGTAISGLNGRKIRSVRLPEVPVSEQRRIVTELDAIQAGAKTLKNLQVETAAKLDALLPAILDRAFKGELSA